MTNDQLLADAFRRGIISEQRYKFGLEDPRKARYVMEIVEAGSELTEAVIRRARAMREEDLKRAEEENRIAVLRAASRMGVSAQVYEEMMLKQAGARTEVDLEVERVQRLAQIEINKVRVMHDDAANRQVKLALLASINEATRRYYDLRARRAGRVEIDNAKRHLDDLERRWQSFQENRNPRQEGHRDRGSRGGYGNRY